MSTLGKLFKFLASRMPRVHGFGSRFYFGHPFLDAWFAWFPLNQIQLDNFPLARQIVFDWIADQMHERNPSR